jgi:hypothetical protein
VSRACHRCGHDRDIHEHLRRGSDCALCGCPKLVRDISVRAILHRLDQVVGLTLAIVVTRLPERITRRFLP